MNDFRTLATASSAASLASGNSQPIHTESPNGGPGRALPTTPSSTINAPTSPAPLPAITRGQKARGALAFFIAGAGLALYISSNSDTLSLVSSLSVNFLIGILSVIRSVGYIHDITQQRDTSVKSRAGKIVGLFLLGTLAAVPNTILNYDITIKGLLSWALFSSLLTLVGTLFINLMATPKMMELYYAVKYRCLQLKHFVGKSSDFDQRRLSLIAKTENAERFLERNPDATTQTDLSIKTLLELPPQASFHSIYKLIRTVFSLATAALVLYGSQGYSCGTTVGFCHLFGETALPITTLAWFHVVSSLLISVVSNLFIGMLCVAGGKEVAEKIFDTTARLFMRSGNRIANGFHLMGKKCAVAMVAAPLLAGLMASQSGGPSSSFFMDNCANPLSYFPAFLVFAASREIIYWSTVAFNAIYASFALQTIIEFIAGRTGTPAYRAFTEAEATLAKLPNQALSSSPEKLSDLLTQHGVLSLSKSSSDESVVSDHNDERRPLLSN